MNKWFHFYIVFYKFKLNSKIDLYFYNYSDTLKQFKKTLLEAIDEKFEKLDKVSNYFLQYSTPSIIRFHYFQIHNFQSTHRLRLLNYFKDISVRI
jgi:hypothetical protein